MQARNFLYFVLSTILIIVIWMWVGPMLEKRPALPPPATEQTTKKTPEPKPEPAKMLTPKQQIEVNLVLRAFDAQVLAAAGSLLAPATQIAIATGIHKQDAFRPVIEQETPTPAKELVTLGSDDPKSKYFIQAVFDPRGACVRQVVLNSFHEADHWGKPTNKLLELIPDEPQPLTGSFQLYHYRENDNSPLDTLGKVKWDKTEPQPTDAGTDTEKRFVSFQTTIDGVQITKTFSLAKGDYHLGLTVKLKRLTPGEKPLKFRYQLAGAHGLPVDGKWYTTTFRNALIARADAGNDIKRDLQDLRQISYWQGGNEVASDNQYHIRYAGVAVQFFASMIVVDNDQEKQDFVARARPTLEKYVAKGHIQKIEQNTFDLKNDDGSEQTFYMSNAVRADVLVWPQNRPVAVVVTDDSRQRAIALQLLSADETQPLWIDDITVRVMTEPVELANNEVTHKYLLYNGPVKPSLLGMPGHASVAEPVLHRYVDTLGLNTMTDYHSNGWAGTFASTIYWTNLLIKCTNIMHWVLCALGSFIPNYGLCIICLTVLVRGLMFPVSRKQAIMSIKMQALAPELKKLQAQYKDDHQARNAAMWQLYNKHNVSPLGSCWFILLQMPIFMGLYYALQESIYFRLAGAWPSWITNLAAPDMLFNWGENIPFISKPQSYGAIYYLGPFFNVLPVLAVTLMIFQQKMMTPPPQDDQQAMQQKVMKYMMVFFGLMFYKVAAGLCLYFISSSVWGFAERKLLPKKKTSIEGDAAIPDAMARPAAPSGSTAISTASSGGRGRKGRVKRRPDASVRNDSETDGSAWSRIRQSISSWWTGMVKKADKR